MRDEAARDAQNELERLAAALKQDRKRGLFISFEGGDGSGKTTQLKLLSDALAKRGVSFLVTREPGGTELGAELRALIQHGPEDVDPRTEALLYAADRAYHVATVIRPTLQSGTHVLEDRYTDSSVAYQGAARKLGTEEVRDLSIWATENLQPDVTILFDLSAEDGLLRLGTGLDRLERAGLAFHERVRREYLQIAAENPDRITVVDAAGAVSEVFMRMVHALAKKVVA